MQVLSTQNNIISQAVVLHVVNIPYSYIVSLAHSDNATEEFKRIVESHMPSYISSATCKCDIKTNMYGRYIKRHRRRCSCPDGEYYVCSGHAILDGFPMEFPIPFCPDPSDCHISIPIFFQVDLFPLATGLRHSAVVRGIAASIQLSLPCDIMGLSTVIIDGNRKYHVKDCYPSNGTLVCQRGRNMYEVLKVGQRVEFEVKKVSISNDPVLIGDIILS